MISVCDRVDELVEHTTRSKRVYKKDSTGVTTYFFDESGGIEHILFEYDGAGNTKARYTLGPRVDEIISRKVYMDEDGQVLEKPRVMFYHYDAFGSVVALSDEKGKVVAEYDYSTFGRIIDWQGGEAKKNVYTFTGREYDADSGLYFYRARYMDARLGRFLQRSPRTHRQHTGMNISRWLIQATQNGSPVASDTTCCGIARSHSSHIPILRPSFAMVMPIVKAHPHSYIYVDNNPTNQTDPTGLPITGPIGQCSSDILKGYYEGFEGTSLKPCDHQMDKFNMVVGLRSPKCREVADQYVNCLKGYQERLPALIETAKRALEQACEADSFYTGMYAEQYALLIWISDEVEEQKKELKIPCWCH